MTPKLRAIPRSLSQPLRATALLLSELGRGYGATEQVGFSADHDHTVSDDLRFVQLTPPGSACSIAIGKGLTQMPPGSLQNIQMVVSDIGAARAELVERGVEVSDVQDLPGGRFVFFSDPDGNGRVVQLPAGT